jgi:hypothetical protein
MRWREEVNLVEGGERERLRVRGEGEERRVKDGRCLCLAGLSVLSVFFELNGFHIICGLFFNGLNEVTIGIRRRIIWMI